MQFSHSRIDLFEKCKLKYKMRYLDGITTDPPTEPDNPLVLGKAVHTGIARGVEAAVQEYYFSYPIITDAHVNEAMKLEAVIPKARAAIPRGGKFEVEVRDKDFIGYIDYLVPARLGCNDMDAICSQCERDSDCPYAYSGYGCGRIRGVKWFDLYDFKYSNNVSSYMESGQLHEYKYFFEKNNPCSRIRNMYFAFIPKATIRQKKDETLRDFRSRLASELGGLEVKIVQVKFNPEKVIEFLLNIKAAGEETDFAAERSHLCRYCEFQEHCEKGWDYNMKLPENKRRSIESVEKRSIWIYGAPFCGKTTFANGFPDPLMLNTDGNIKFVDAPYIYIKDDVRVEGRQTKRTLAWEVFKDVVAELEKKDNTFKTIVVDLLEDLYEHCRLYMYQQMGITHESDDSFRAWDKVRGEFLNTLKRLMNLPYENIVLISHEDTTKDITKKGGDKVTSIKPNLQDKVAVKVAGMVDVVARIVADGDVRTFCFKQSEVIFGGGRLKVDAKDIPLSVGALFAVYDEANAAAAHGGAAIAPKPARGTRKRTETPATDAYKPHESPERASAVNDATEEVAPEFKDVPNVCLEDTYFYVPNGEGYVMRHKGEEIPKGAVEITEEQFGEGVRLASQEADPPESPDGAMNPPEAAPQEEKPRRRRKRREADDELPF